MVHYRIQDRLLIFSILTKAKITGKFEQLSDF